MAREDFWDYAQRARSAGKDLAEVLDREGVLLTSQRRFEIRSEMLSEVLELLRSTEAHHWFPNGTPQTPRDLKSIFENHLEGRIDDENAKSRL